METRVRISGFKELGRELGRVGPEYQKRLRAVNKALATEVAAGARRRYAQHYTSRGGGSIKTIRALGAQARASVSIGSASEPQLIGQEFGSVKFRQFRPWSGPPPSGGPGSRGKFLWPAVRDVSDEQIERYGEELMRVMAAAFPQRG